MPYTQQEIEFTELLSRNYTIINGICLKSCRGDAYYFDELRQECILEIWEEFSKYGLTRFRGDSTEATWIFQIAYHAIAHYYRKSKYSEFQSINDIYDTEFHFYYENSDGWQLLDEFKEQLNNQELQLLDHYLNEDTYCTIAHVSGITESNARKRMSRLINKLRMLVHK